MNKTAGLHMGCWPILFGQNGRLLAVLFVCVYMDQDIVEVHKHVGYLLLMHEQGGNIDNDF